MAIPIATPAANAPTIMGTGFSRRKYSVRSRTRTAFCFVCSQASPRGCIGAAMGLSSIKSLSLVSITMNSQLKAGLRFSNVRGTISWQNNNREAKGAKVAEPKKEEIYWREQHAKQPYADKNLAYERNKAGSALPWDHARHAVHAACAKLSGGVGPRDSDRGIRGAI